MKRWLWLVGFALGVSFALGCDGEDEEGVLFACGDDMCLSSEEFCASYEDCSGQTESTAQCAPLEDMDVQTFCSGSDEEGYHCGNACG